MSEYNSIIDFCIAFFYGNTSSLNYIRESIDFLCSDGADARIT